MEIKANVKNLRTSARKARLVVDIVRGMQVEKALDQLQFVNKRVTKPVIKLINSAIANAENTYELSKDNLFVKEITVNEGATLKRWMPRAHGRATPIRKRTSHISLVLGELKDSGKKEAKKQKIEAPIKLGEQPKEAKEEKKPTAAKKKEESPTKKTEDLAAEKIVDPRGEGHGKNAKIEGGSSKGFAGKVFRRKSG
ncbi:50S ribosomal protein L22 [Candidatus Parcubacteria bacterium]|nr:MAG: 50S ribosomal protein L22 [Candidatus Parcubacteria bacterium]